MRKRREGIRVIQPLGLKGIQRIPKPARGVLALLSIIAVGTFTYYIATAYPLFGRASAPTVQTGTATSVVQDSATLAGEITAGGGAQVTAKGFQYGQTTSYGNTANATLDGGYDLQYTFPSGFGNDQLYIPTSIAHDSQNNIYVTSSPGKIVKYSSSGAHIRTWEWISKLDGQGEVIENIGFSGGLSVAVDSSGNMYILDKANKRVIKADSEGIYITEWGSSGTGNTQFGYPNSITIDSENKIYVTDSDGFGTGDSANNRVLKFSDEGLPLLTIGGPGSNDGQFPSTALNSAVASDGVIYVSSAQGGIQKFLASGAFDSRVGTINYPGDPIDDGDLNYYGVTGLALDSQNNLFVSDNNYGRIQQFSPLGDFTMKFSQAGGNGNQYFIDVDGLGQLYTPNATGDLEKYTKGSEVGQYSTQIDTLVCNRTYHYRAFATNEDGTSYGDDAEFTTTACTETAPVVTTNAATSITATSAVLNGTVDNFGSQGITERSFVYGVVASGANYTQIDTDSSTDDYSVTATNLTCGTKYTFYAKATNSAATTQATSLTFTTADCPPIVKTVGAGGILQNEVNVRGQTSPKGVISRGVRYGKTLSYGSTKTDTSTIGYTRATEKWPFNLDGLYRGLSFDHINNLYAAHVDNNINPLNFPSASANSRIEKLTTSGNLLATISSQGSGSGQFNFEGSQSSSPVYMAFTDNKVYVTDCGNNKVHRIDIATGSVEASFSQFFVNPEETVTHTFDCPKGIAVDGAGRLHVVDSGNETVFTFDANDTSHMLYSFGDSGTGNGQFTGAGDIAFDSLGNKFVSDGTRIQKFGPSSAYISQINISATTEFSIDSEDNLYAYSVNGISIHVFNNLGIQTKTYAISDMRGFDVDKRHDIYVGSPIQSLSGSDEGVQRLTGSIEVTIDALDCGSTYHYQAFSTTAQGTVFGSDRTFTTANCTNDQPVVTTNASSNTTQSSSALNGTIENVGAGGITEKGFYFGATTSYGTTLTQSVNPDQLAYAGKWTFNGSNGVRLDSLDGMTTDEDGNVYSVDSQNNLIQKYDSQGNLIARGGNAGSDTVLSYPQDIAVGGNGLVYVTDLVECKVKVFYPDTLQLFDEWGTCGSGTGELSAPRGITFNPVDGHLYIADAGNNRVQIFSTGGTYQGGWGSQGTGNTQFDFMNDIESDAQGNIYVADVNNNKVKAFDINGTPLLQIGPHGTVDPGDTPQHIATDSIGNIYIDGWGDVVQKFTKQGSFLTEFAPVTAVPGSTWASGIALNRLDDLYLGAWQGVYPNYNISIQKFVALSQTGSFSDVITGLTCSTSYHYQAFATNPEGTGLGADQQFTTPTCPTPPTVVTNPASSTTETSSTLNGEITDTGTGNITQRGFQYGTSTSYTENVSEMVNNPVAYAGKWGQTGDGPSKFQEMLGVATDPSGNVYVTDRATGRIQKFSSAGDFILEWDGSDTQDGQLSGSLGIASDPAGNIFVADTGNNRIRKFSATGEPLLTWGSGGTNPGQFDSPGGVAVDKLGNIYVVDALNFRIQKFNNNGVFITSWGSFGTSNGQFGGTAAPFGIAIDSSNNVYVTDSGNYRVQKFSSTGTFIGKWGTQGSGDNNLAFPTGIAVGSDNTVFVADTNNSRIVRYTDNGVYIAQWGNPLGSADGQFNAPFGLAINKDGTIYAGDVLLNRVQAFTPLSQLGAFDTTLNDLTCATTYHFRAYAISGTSAGYGNDRQFTTPACTTPEPSIPTVVTLDADNLLATGTTLNGNVTSAGSSAVTSRGFEWGQTTSYGDTLTNGSATTGLFSDITSSVTCGSTYHFRAFAINSVGTGQGADKTFVVPCPSYPTVVTDPPTALGRNAATLNGRVTSAGSSSLIDRGFQFGLTTSYGTTYTDSVATTGAMSKVLSSLECDTVYNYRAFASNSLGTSYGANYSFGTSSCNLPPTVVITAPTNNQVFGAKTTSVTLTSEAFSPTSTIERVEFYVDGTYVGTVNDEPYTMNALGLPVGKHTLVTKAWDVLGASAVAVPVDFFVDPPYNPPTGCPPRCPVVTPPTPPATTPTVTPTQNGTNTPIVNKGGTTGNEVQARQTATDKAFSNLSYLLILALLIVAAMYARQTYLEYRLRAKVIAAIRRVEATQNATNDFIDITSHILNTPIAIMGGAVDLGAVQKLLPMATLESIRTRISNFASAVQKLLKDNALSVKQNEAIDPKLAVKTSNPLKEKAVWLPGSIVLVLLILANLLFARSDLLRSSTVQTVVQFILFALVFALIVLARHYREVFIVTRDLLQENLAARAQLLQKRRQFIETATQTIDSHYDELKAAGARLNDTTEAKHYNGGLAMIAKLKNGLNFVYHSTDIEKRPGAFDLSFYLNQLSKDFKAKAQKNNTDILVSIADGLTIRADATDMHQIIDSVVDNAITFSKPNNEVRINARKQFGKIVITVSDNGVGLPEDKLNQLFQPFTRATSTKTYDYDGAGISLFVDRVVVTKLGGTITASSKVNEGTSITIKLPAAERADAINAPSLITPTTAQMDRALAG